ncbi:MAG: FAD-binding oxidoreductase, partial [Phascolarctobacterium sp.]|nr:FAD-binding oxidoreductase [Phascolarctobacterium sp.]
MNYTKINEEILAKLTALVGAENVLISDDKLKEYSHDEVTDPAYHHLPEVVVMAENANQVAAVVKLANEFHFPVTPRGAGTGLACGAVPIYGGVVLSLEKMNKIIEINEDAMYAIVEPGVRTSDLQKAVDAKGC